MEARSECFKAGGDLARFSGTNGADFYGIVRQLDPESSSIIQINDPKAYPVWFKSSNFLAARLISDRNS